MSTQSNEKDTGIASTVLTGLAVLGGLALLGVAYNTGRRDGWAACAHHVVENAGHYSVKLAEYAAEQAAQVASNT